ncbi:hypothetical protein FGO68_gene13543 [Halteria grandinella]|uniref:RING-type E3 ubiquitin transferase n=1 Tax=Halteria grandinella TaxID=5974 RepID=A0A8J8SZT3_HALGN|nr:hypothetical protein FGO68_gene13543 [Halteria grandinella]
MYRGLRTGCPCFRRFNEGQIRTGKRFPVYNYEEYKTFANNTDSNGNISQQENPYQEEVCPICCDKFTQEVLLLPCNIKHIYHPACIQGWLSKHKECPLCKQNAFV